MRVLFDSIRGRTVTSIILIGLFGGLAFDLRADEWPDGVIDRSTQVDVWPDRIHVEMSFGMNDNTVQTILSQYLPDFELEQASITERLMRVAKLVCEQLADDLEVYRNGERVTFDHIIYEQSAQHHIRFFCYFTANGAVAENQSEVLVNNGIFIDFQPQIRPALRGRKMDILRSNVEPIVVRSERIYLQQLEASLRDDANSIKASLAKPGWRTSLPVITPTSLSRPLPPQETAGETGTEDESSTENSAVPEDAAEVDETTEETEISGGLPDEQEERPLPTEEDAERVEQPSYLTFDQLFIQTVLFIGGLICVGLGIRHLFRPPGSPRNGDPKPKS